MTRCETSTKETINNLVMKKIRKGPNEKSKNGDRNILQKKKKRKK